MRAAERDPVVTEPDPTEVGARVIVDEDTPAAVLVNCDLSSGVELLNVTFD